MDKKIQTAYTEAVNSVKESGSVLPTSDSDIKTQFHNLFKKCASDMDIRKLEKVAKYDKEVAWYLFSLEHC